MTPAARAAYLAAGTWPNGNGTAVRLAEMHPAHLVNAYLAALGRGDGPEITEPLARAVVTRGLAERAWAEAQKRTSVYEIGARPKAKR